MDERFIKYSKISLALQIITILALLLLSWMVLLTYFKSVEARQVCVDREYQNLKAVICQDLNLR
ncbi:hypothetical protein A2480_00255 [Candidatus Uhrbacteria bacterium RIFOXYC2_FULL_47_19]|uniref:Uncharacterized protein n=1 Tax=Candidatus Uhrbacteria bacterium RIFOXYC2_FULL_47_19 TaxID=1802424 RepID=A0A1F7WEB7_9BACT|nr:MAG: hypothetical protein A2480_00255 [Candidatus Uhrbacteria bacterium RIFOXYC2_FULL_47_19]HCC22282.1 hypothetical protein [Candidatus Uhrbacteria bacterium]